MVLTCSILPPGVAEVAASAFFIITGVTVVASAAPPAIRLEFLRKVRRFITPGIALRVLQAVVWLTVQDFLVNFFMSLPLSP